MISVGSLAHACVATVAALAGETATICWHMWQSRIEIEYYSVAYFERITEFDAP